MKRIVILMLVLAVMVCGCVQNPEPTTKPTTMPTTEPTTEPTTPPTTEPAVPPTTAPTTQPTTEPSTAPTASEDTEDLVWIPQSGKKYHIKSTCSSMKDPTQVTKEEAENRGFTPCKRCYP